MKRMLYIALVLLMCLSMMLTASAYTSGQQKTADALHELELFLGTDKGYELDNKLTRAQGVTLLIRMMGKETEATMNVLKTPFEDVPAWAEGYIGYAYAHGITKGVSAINFGSDAELSDYMFLTLVLRALGYSDSGESARFVWNNPYALATEVGLIDQNAADSNLTRGDTVEILWNAMSVKLAGKEITLAESLIEQGVFTAEDYTEAVKIEKNGLPQKPAQLDKNEDYEDEAEDNFTPSPPNTPSTPSQPSTPSTPSQPEKPVEPQQPEQPSEPSQPDQPSGPNDENAGEEDEF